METGHKKSSSSMITEKPKLWNMESSRSRKVEIYHNLHSRNPFSLHYLENSIQILELNSAGVHIQNPISWWDIICILVKRHPTDWKMNLFTISVVYLLNPQNIQISLKIQKQAKSISGNEQFPSYTPIVLFHTKKKRVGSMSKWVLVSVKLSLTWRLRCSLSRLPGCKNRPRRFRTNSDRADWPTLSCQWSAQLSVSQSWPQFESRKDCQGFTTKCMTLILLGLNRSSLRNSASTNVCCCNIAPDYYYSIKSNN